MLAKILYKLAYWVMRLKGWTFHGERPKDRKFILLGAPHTSNWDFILTWALMSYFDLPLKYFVKDQIFKGPLKPFFISMGAMPIDRSRRLNMVERTIEAFQENDDIVIGILPEGTRKYVEHWKSGFYHIAQGAKVPLILAGVDGVNKKLILLDRFETTGDIQADMEKLAEIFGDIKGMVPEFSGPVRLKAQLEEKVTE